MVDKRGGRWGWGGCASQKPFSPRVGGSLHPHAEFTRLRDTAAAAAAALTDTARSCKAIRDPSALTDVSTHQLHSFVRIITAETSIT